MPKDFSSRYKYLCYPAAQAVVTGCI